MKRRRGRGLAWTPAEIIRRKDEKFVRFHEELAHDDRYGMDPCPCHPRRSEIRVVVIDNPWDEPKGEWGAVFASYARTMTDQIRWQQRRLAAKATGVGANPVRMGKHAPDDPYRMPRNFRYVEESWAFWMREATPCAIGQPAPAESTLAWESRVQVLGRPLDGRIPPTRVG